MLNVSSHNELINILLHILIHIEYTIYKSVFHFFKVQNILCTLILFNSHDEWSYLQGVPCTMCTKKNVLVEKLPSNFQNAKVGCVLKNWGYLLQHGHWDFENWWRNDWKNEASSCQPSSKNGQNSLLTIHIHWSS